MLALKNYLQENAKKNMKKIAGILGDIIISILTVSLFAAKSGLDPISSLMMIVMTIKPFIVLYVNLIFKGESDDANKQLALTTQQAITDRELAEYRVQLAAIKGTTENGVVANKQWNDANEALKQE